MVENKRAIKTIAMFIMALLVCVMVNISNAYAANGDVIDKGEFGADVTYTITEMADGNYAIDINGSGPMKEISVGYSADTSSIPWYKYADKVTKVTIGEGITTIGTANFFYMSAMETVSIPSTVKEIHDYAFIACENLKAIDFPSGLTSLGKGAFHWCYSIQKVDIPKGVKVIPADCFEYCSELTTVIMHDGVEEIGDYAFFYNKKLTSITIPSTVKTIGWEPFDSTPFFTNLQSNEMIIVGDGILVKYNGATKNLVIPNTIKKIHTQAFKGNKTLEKVTIPESVIEIGAEAFCNCENLTEVSMTSNVKAILFNAFENTPFINNNNEDFIILGEHILYKYNTSDKEMVTIPSTVDYIASHAFYAHTELKNVSIPSSVKTIYDYAFVSCNNIKYLDIPDSVNYIGEYALGWTYADITSGQLRGYNIILIGKADSATEKYASKNANCTFVDRDELEGKCGDSASYKIDIKTGKLIISGTEMMYDFSYASAPWYSANSLITEVVIEEGITYLGRYAFQRMNISKLVLPDSMKILGQNSIYECDNITEINLPKEVYSITNCGLYTCSSLEKITVDENNPNYISVDGVLYSKDMSNLLLYPRCKAPVSEYVIPKSVQYLSDYAFYDINSIDRLIIKGDISSIIYEISNCTFDLILFEGKAPWLNRYSFSGVNSNCKICYYSTEEGWDKYKSLDISSNENDLIDLAELNTGNITIIPSSTTIECGDTLNVQIIADTMSNKDFVWSSSNPLVAAVDSEGNVKGISKGSAVITATSPDGTHKYECKVTVNGIKIIAENELIKLGNDISFTSVYNLFEMFTVEGVDGVYLLQDNVLKFLSFYTMEMNDILELPVSEDAYIIGDKLYIVGDEGNAATLWRYDLKTLKGTKVVKILGERAISVIADSNGNIYFATTKGNSSYIHSYSATGKYISSTSMLNRIYSLSALDETNGNLYMEAWANWRYWGYDHDTRSVYAVNTQNGKLSKISPILGNGFADNLGGLSMMNCNLILGQLYYSEHRDSVELINNKYLACSSLMMSYLGFLDSNKYQVGEEETEYYLQLDRAGSEFEVDGYDIYGVGTKCAYIPEINTTLIYTNGNRIIGCNLDNNTFKYELYTKNPVFSLKTLGDYVVALEKDAEGTFYIELYKWVEPTEIELSIDNSTINVGEIAKLESKLNGTLAGIISYSSSDPSIASVNDSGIVVGQKEGSVTITAQDEASSIKTSITVTVKANTNLKPSVGAIVSNGTMTDNESDNNYTVWSNPDDSYLYEESDGTLVRVEWTGEKVLIEKYGSDYKKKSNVTISQELPLFGGFFCGKDYNFIVYGQNNPSDSKSVEVLRVVKYSKDWKRIAAKSIYGANTYIPFDAGSCRMTETEGILYIHTCHEMFMSDDGLHHQANMTYKIQESDLTIISQNYDVQNFSYGYVSHSFNQFIKADKNNIYRVDHGDASPRGVSYSVTPIENDVTKIVFGNVPYGINGYLGNNSTGVSVGGFEISPSNYVIAINSVDMTDADNYSAYGNRNIYLISSPLNGRNVSVTQITKYTANDKVTVYTPQLVKYSDYTFILLWEEQDGNYNRYTKMVMVTDQGVPVAEPIAIKARLSDCQPVVTKDGLVTWYVTDGTQMKFYAYNPFDLNDFEVIVPESTTINIEKEFGAAEEEIKIYKNIEGAKITYTSLDEKIVKVTSDGKMSFVGVGSTEIKVSIAEGDRVYAATSVIKVTVAKANISNATIKVNGTYVYTGKAQTPDITIQYAGKTLVKGTDYVLGADNNINAGTATYNIVGRNNFKGSFTGTFQISKSNYVITGVNDAYSMSCNEKTISLSASSDGKITYSSDNTAIATVSASGVITKVSTGTAHISVKAEGDDNHNGAIKEITVTTVAEHTIVIDKAIAPTCTTAGLTEGSHCSVCNTIITAQKEAPATGHKAAVDKAVAPTCTKTGLTEGSHCSVCNTVIKLQETVKATGHNWNSGEVTSTSTCAGSGVITYTCITCGEKKTEATSANGHKVVIDKAVAATCTTNGKTEGTHCSVCGTVIKAQEIISATGHKTVIDKAVPATCTASGKTEGSHCSVCNTTITAQKDIPATGHNLQITEAKPASYISEGWTEGKRCLNCGTLYGTSVKIPRLPLPFKDVKGTEWFVEELRYMYQYQLITGYSSKDKAGCFGPKDELSRAQAVTILWRAFGEPKAKTTAKFKDVSVGQYYTEAVSWAQENDIVTGYNDAARKGLFGTKDPITKQQLALILQRIAFKYGYSKEIGSLTAYKACTDSSNVSSYALDGVRWAYNNGIIGTNGELGAKRNVKRNETSSMIYRALNLFGMM